jgi:hypothetical protein
MDHAVPAQNDGAFKDTVNAARQLFEDAHFKAQANIPSSAEQGKAAEKGNEPSASRAVNAEDRLQFASKTAAQLSERFTQLDTSDNGFLGKHELNEANKTIPATQVILKHYDDIIPLYYDHLNAYKSTISQDHLGVSKGDLKGLAAVTSNNHDDLLAYARSQALDTFPGRAGFILGGVTAGTSAVAGFVGLCERRTGLIGLGIGLGVMAAGGIAGYYQQKNSLESLRDKIGKDNSLDSLIFSDRLKALGK